MVGFAERLAGVVGDLPTFINTIDVELLAEQVHIDPPGNGEAQIQVWRDLAERLTEKAYAHGGLDLGEGFTGRAAQKVRDRITEYQTWCQATALTATRTAERLVEMYNLFAALKQRVPNLEEVRRNRAEVRKYSNVHGALEFARLNAIYLMWEERCGEALINYHTGLTRCLNLLPTFTVAPLPVAWSQRALDAVNAPFQWAFDRPLIGDGKAGVPGQNGGAGGILYGNGGHGGDSLTYGMASGHGGSAGFFGHGGHGGNGYNGGVGGSTPGGHGGHGGTLYGPGGSGGNGYHSSGGTGGRAYLFGNAGHGGAGVHGGVAGESGLLIGHGGGGGGTGQHGTNGGLLYGKGGWGSHSIDTPGGNGGRAWLIGGGGNGGDSTNAAGGDGGHGGFFFGDGGHAGHNHPGNGNGGRGGSAGLFGYGGQGGDGFVAGDGGSGGLVYGDGGDGGGGVGPNGWGSGGRGGNGGNGGNAAWVIGNRGWGGDGLVSGNDGRNGLFHDSVV